MNKPLTRWHIALLVAAFLLIGNLLFHLNEEREYQECEAATARGGFPDHWCAHYIAVGIVSGRFHSTADVLDALQARE